MHIIKIIGFFIFITSTKACLISLLRHILLAATTPTVYLPISIIFWMRPLHFPHASPVSSFTPVPAPVISPTFSTVLAPSLTAFTTAPRETFLHQKSSPRLSD